MDAETILAEIMALDKQLYNMNLCRAMSPPYPLCLCFEPEQLAIKEKLAIDIDKLESKLETFDVWRPATARKPPDLSTAT